MTTHPDNSTRFEAQKVAVITPTGNDRAVFWEVFTIITVDGVEKHHRNSDRTFKTREEAEKWISENCN